MDRTGNASQVESQAIVGLAVQQRSINRPFFSGQSGCWGGGEGQMSLPNPVSVCRNVAIFQDKISLLYFVFPVGQRIQMLGII